MNSICIQENDRILIIAPHPDDESIGMGGFLLKYSDKTDVWIMTDGSRCQTEVTEKEIVEIRKKETEKVMSMLGVRKCVYFNLKDRTMAFNEEIFDNMNFSVYSKIFVPSDEEKHIDHLSTSVVSLTALRKRNVSADVYFYEITSPMANFNCYLDITDCIADKCRLIDNYKSQTCIFDYVNAAYYLNGFRGCMQGRKKNFLEVYKKINVYTYQRKTDKLEIAINMKIINILKDWLYAELSQNGIENYFKKSGIKKIDVYGYGRLGKLVFDIIGAVNSVKLGEVIDKNFRGDTRYVNPQEYKPKSDAVVVTLLGRADGVISELKAKGTKKIYLLSELIEQMKNAPGGK